MEIFWDQNSTDTYHKSVGYKVFASLLLKTGYLNLRLYLHYSIGNHFIYSVKFVPWLNGSYYGPSAPQKNRDIVQQ